MLPAGKVYMANPLWRGSLSYHMNAGHGSRARALEKGCPARRRAASWDARGGEHAWQEGPHLRQGHLTLHQRRPCGFRQAWVRGAVLQREEGRPGDGSLPRPLWRGSARPAHRGRRRPRRHRLRRLLKRLTASVEAAGRGQGERGKGDGPFPLAVGGAPPRAEPGRHHLRRRLDAEVVPLHVQLADLELLPILQRLQGRLQLLVAGVGLDGAREHAHRFVVARLLVEEPGVGAPDEALLAVAAPLERLLEHLLHGGQVALLPARDGQHDARRPLPGAGALQIRDRRLLIALPPQELPDERRHGRLGSEQPGRERKGALGLLDGAIEAARLRVGDGALDDGGEALLRAQVERHIGDGGHEDAGDYHRHPAEPAQPDGDGDGDSGGEAEEEIVHADTQGFRRGQIHGARTASQAKRRPRVTSLSKVWPSPDSNRDGGLPHSILSRARLPFRQRARREARYQKNKLCAWCRLYSNQPKTAAYMGQSVLNTPAIRRCRCPVKPPAAPSTRSCGRRWSPS